MRLQPNSSVIARKVILFIGCFVFMFYSIYVVVYLCFFLNPMDIKPLFALNRRTKFLQWPIHGIVASFHFLKTCVID